MGTSTASYTEGPMDLSGLLPVLAEDPAVAERCVRRGRGAAAREPGLDVVLPPGLPALLAALLDPVGCAARARSSWWSRPGVRPRSSPPRCGPTLRARRRGRGPAVVGDPAARAALAAQRHRRPAGWRCSGGSPTPTPTARGARCGWSSCRSGRCCSRVVAGLGELVPVALRAGGHGGPRAGRAGPGGRRVHPGRHGRAARGVRGARRHPRRLPAHRRPPAAGRVLGRPGRGDPLVRGRRPAQPRGRRRTGCGRRRAARSCSPTRCGRAPARWRTSCPGAADMLAKLADGIAVEGMESLAPVLVDEMVPLLDWSATTRWSWWSTRSGSGAARTTWRRPARSSSRPPGRAAAAGAEHPDRPVGGVVRELRRHPRAGAVPAAGLVDAEPVRAGARRRARRATGAGGRTGRDATATARRRRAAARSRSARARCTATAATSRRAVADLHELQRARLAPGAGHRGARPGRADGRAAGRRRRARPAWSPAVAEPPGARRRPGHRRGRCRAASSAEDLRLARAHRVGPDRARRDLDPGHALDALAPAAHASTRSRCGPGDFVVHEQHGVGRFVELTARTVGSGQAVGTREYLVIEYAPSKRGQPGDRL